MAECLVWCTTVVGLSSRLGLGFVSQSQLSVQTLNQCLYSSHVQLHALTSVCTWNISWTGSQNIVFDMWKCSTHQVSPWRRNVTALVAGELKMVSYIICLLKNSGCSTSINRGTQMKKNVQWCVIWISNIYAKSQNSQIICLKTRCTCICN